LWSDAAFLVEIAIDLDRQLYPGWTSWSVCNDSAGARRCPSSQHQSGKGEIGFLPNKAKKRFVFTDGDCGTKDQGSPGSRNWGRALQIRRGRFFPPAGGSKTVQPEQGSAVARKRGQVCELLLRGGIHEYEREGSKYLHLL
jgi:hypothetical protein